MSAEHRNRSIRRNPGRRNPGTDSAALRRALGNFVTGVTVVTTIDEVGRPRGLTVNSFTSVSLDPPLILVCVASDAASCEAFLRCHSFAVNVLNEEQRRVSDVFATKSPDKFDHVSWTPGRTGSPVIQGSLATFDCRVHERIEAGDHVVVVGEVIAFEAVAGRPLAYGQGGYISFSVQEAAVAQPPGRNVVVSCIAEREGRVLLLREDGPEGEGWVLPNASLMTGGSDELTPLKDAFRRLGVRVEITFLYSVFETAGPPAVFIVYRGALREAPEPGSPARLFSEDAVPWDALKPSQCRAMLRRFFRERTLDQFGVYMDVEDGGRVASLGKAPQAWSAYLSHLKNS
jgi:flavin reductase (DIM6/NTAB) family NADH-FMN oxidoreductase RutF